MSKETIIIAATETLLRSFEKRLEAVEKAIGKNFHGSSGYTKGCRCEVCKEARRLSMQQYRTKLKKEKAK